MSQHQGHPQSRPTNLHGYLQGKHIFSLIHSSFKSTLFHNKSVKVHRYCRTDKHQLVCFVLYPASSLVTRMANPNSRAAAVAQAQALVESIAEDHGYLGEEDYAEMSPRLRRRVEHAQRKKDMLIGSSVITYGYLSNSNRIGLLY